MGGIAGLPLVRLLTSYLKEKKMKKLAIFLAIMLIPFSAFALDTISDNDLDSVTGQAGVSIFTNSIQIVKTGVTTTYTDDNGTGNTTLTGNNNAGNFSIVEDRTVTQIYFLGYDPINVDVVDMADAVSIINAAAEVGAGATVDGTGGTGSFYGANEAVLAFNSTTGYGYNVDELGLSGVQITLPNMIEIQSLGSTKTYYATDASGITDGEHSLIRITTTGGKTRISLALKTSEEVKAAAAVAYGTIGTLPVTLGEVEAGAINAYLQTCEDLAWSNAANEGDASSGTPEMRAAGITHADQIKVLITSHE
jgi:hypothetical protein